MQTIPHDKSPDSTLAVAREGYEFIGNRCRRYQTDVFEARIGLQKMICMRGEEAARIFYDKEHFERADVTPGFVKKTLFGEGGVQGLDDEAHLHRKKLFMSVMGEHAQTELSNLMERNWIEAQKKWESMPEVHLAEASAQVLTRTICEWTGVPLKQEELAERAKQLTLMFEGPGSIGLKHFRSRAARKNCEKWIAGLVRAVRDGSLNVDESKALSVFAQHRNLEGELLDEKVAAVEILNLLRPTVAICRYIVFEALALHNYPECAERIRADNDGYTRRFVQEVRRFYPFFPFTAARVRKAFDWNGYHFPEGRKALLDLYGTNHHEAAWSDPLSFRPDRFLNWEGNAHKFIPQGGGDHFANHRCAGEWVTIALMKIAAERLTRMRYLVPPQDLSVDLSHMPAMPASGFKIDCRVASEGATH